MTSVLQPGFFDPIAGALYTNPLFKPPGSAAVQRIVANFRFVMKLFPVYISNILTKHTK